RPRVDAAGPLHALGAALRPRLRPRLARLRRAGRSTGRAVVCRRDGARAGFRLCVLLASSRRALPDAVRSREAGLVLPARLARRYAAVDAALARLRAISRPALAARRPTPPSRARLFPLIGSVVSVVFLRLRLQASGVHSAGHAVAGSGFELLSE